MMKKVIFICLLSLTTCLSRPDGTQEVAATSISPNAVSPTAKAPTDPAVAPVLAPVVTPAPPASTNNPALPTHPVTAENGSIPATQQNNTNKPEQKPDTADGNKTTNKTAIAGESTTSETPAVLPTNGTDKKITTTLAPPAHEDKSNGTATPKAEVTTKAPVKPIEVAGRGFDGASFIGGIILTLGLLAVGFMGFKYYRNQTERNYHTL